MGRTYLEIPYDDKDFAKKLCTNNRTPKVIFDDARKQWYFPSKRVPIFLSRIYKTIETIDTREPDVAFNDTIEKLPFEYTDEQKAFIATEPAGPERLLIGKAFAGAAKTTTLRGYTLARPTKTFLYVAFNASVAKEAKATFPPNTEASTIHALSFAALPGNLKRKFSDEFKADAVCALLHAETTSANLSTASMILKLLGAFFVSNDKMPSSYHLKPAETANLRPCDIDQIVSHSIRVWTSMCDPYSSTPITSDAHLKLYSLSEPVWKFDYIVLDEAQDTNPVTESIFFSQKTAKIVVGDRHQNIYTFRQSRDILTPRVGSCPTLHLSISFRFGPEIANFANILLRKYKGESHEVIGKGAPSKILAPGISNWSINRDGVYKRHAIITRSNAELFNRMVNTINCIEAYEEVTQKPGPKIAFVGTEKRFRFSPYNTYKFSRLYDLMNLGEGLLDKIKDPYISRFKSIEQLRSLVKNKNTHDPDMLASLGLYQRYKRAIAVYCSKAQSRAADPKDPNVHTVFTTAHKSKGLEWSRVMLADDFCTLVNPESGNFEHPEEEEVNLLYVAATRSELELEVNPKTMDFLRFNGNMKIVPSYTPGTDYPDYIPWRKERWIEYFKRKAA